MLSKNKVCVDLVIPGASANPAPPVGSALGPRGINLQDFCKQFNDLTKDLKGTPIRVSVYISPDKKFTIGIKGVPLTHLIKTVAGLSSASKKPGLEVVASITMAQVDEVISKKNGGFNSTEQSSMRSMVAGTARSMGIVVVD